MLKPTWYLTNVDWYAQWPDAPKLDNDGQAVLGQIAELFHDESYFNPAKTAATTLVMLLAAEHLGDVITYAAGQHDVTELARLIDGLNLIQAHLTQIIQTVAEHADKRTFHGLADLPAATVKTVIDSLCAAGASGEVCAGHLKEAHLTLRTAAS